MLTMSTLSTCFSRVSRFSLLLLVVAGLTILTVHGDTRSFTTHHSRFKAPAIPGFTMMIATYKRDALLEPLLSHLTTNPPPSLRQIVIIWQNVGRPLPSFLLPSSLSTFSKSGIRIAVRQSKKNSMNERFRPTLDWGDELETEVAMIMDDDVVLTRETLEWGYQEYLKVNPFGSDSDLGRIVGFTGRDWKRKEDGELEYVVQPMKEYSMILSNAAWFRREWMQRYWEDDEEMSMLRDYIDEVFNCDDLLINYIVSNITHLPPLLLQPRTPLRTIPGSGLWNRGTSFLISGEESIPAPLPSILAQTDSSTPDAPRPEHWLQRPICLRYFFDHFSTFAPSSPREGEAEGEGEEKDQYPLIKTETSTSQDVVDHARWMYAYEHREDTHFEPEEEYEMDDLARQNILDSLTEEEVLSLLERFEHFEGEDEDEEEEESLAARKMEQRVVDEL